MPQTSFDPLRATRKLEQTGCPRPRAEVIVSLMVEATRVADKMATDLARLTMHVEENVVTKAHLAEVLDQYDLKNMVTRDSFTEAIAAFREELSAFRREVSQSFVQLYRHLLVGALGLAGVIIGFVKFLWTYSLSPLRQYRAITAGS